MRSRILMEILRFLIFGIITTETIGAIKMNIRPTNIGGIARAYQKNVNSTAPKSGQAKHASKQDVVEISREALEISEFGGVVRSTAAEVAREVPAETIQKLREAIESGTYSVPGEMIARAILERIIE